VSLAVRRALLVLVGVLVAEAVWIMAVPPFRGSDEVDHVFRAAGVAHGQFHLSQGTPHGRGTLVRVPDDLVEAAQPQCLALSYPGPDNCRPLSSDGGDSLIATAAGAYDPVFYVVVGTVARPFHGASADYAMRIASAIMCAVVLALAVGVMSAAGAGRWATLGVLAAITPEVLFSGAMPSANGLEMTLGLLLWAALLAAVRQRTPDREARYLAVAFAAAVPLTFLRMLGPFWILVIVLSVAAYAGWGTVRGLVGRHRRLVALGVTAVGLGCVWWLTWQVIASHVTGLSSDKDSEKWILAFNLPAFTLQMVGAFPFRDEPAPLAVYPLAFFVIGLMVIAACRRGSLVRERRAVLGIVVLSLVIPILFSVAFMPSLGAFWQGRYELPYVIGILPLCGLVLDDAGFAPQEGRRLVGLSAVFLLITQVACPVHVQQLELDRAVSARDVAWFYPPVWVTGLLMAVGWGIVTLLLRYRTTEPVSS
jgi:hypothetical protein